MRHILAVIAVLAALVMWGCGSRGPDFLISGESVPNYTGQEQTSPTQVLLNKRVEQSLTVRDANVQTTQKYAEWFLSQGWTRTNLREDFDAMNVTFSKGEKQFLLTFRAGSGLTIRGSTPEATSK